MVICRVPLKVHVWNPSSMSVAACLEHLSFCPPSELLIPQLQYSSGIICTTYYSLHSPPVLPLGPVIVIVFSSSVLLG